MSLLLITALLQQVVAQDRAISGRVTDRETNQGLPGVTVLVKGTTVGASTNSDGTYSLNIPASATTLQFSFVGYRNIERTIGNNATIDVAMEVDTKQLNEVVVTAFGIERETKALTYSAQNVSGEAVQRVGQPNVTNALQGKVSGVIVRQSSGMPGSSSLITVRGSRSFTGNNQPLYVVDGLPIESNADFGGGISGTDASSRALDLNPNDIENITVLKGGAASALYGLRGSNGVVVITTKRGRGQSKPVLSFSSDYTMDEVSVLPELQSKYAQGSGGNFNQNTSLSWGPALADLNPATLDKGGKPLVPGKAYDNVSPFFRTGHTFNNAFDLSGAGEYGNFALGLGYTKQEGVVPTTGMERYNAKVAGDFNLSPKIKLGASVNYADTYVDKLPGGSNLSNPLFTTYYAPRSFDLWGIPFESPNNPYSQIHYRAGMDNPRWALAHNSFNERTHRVFGSTNIAYKPLDYLTVNYRLGLDYYVTDGKEFYDLGSGFTGGRTATPSGGQLNDYAQSQNQVNSNFNINFDKNITEDINVNVLVGNELYDIRRRLLNLTGQGVTIGGLRNIDNTVTQFTSEVSSARRVVGFYANLNTSWKDMIFLNASARQDYVSNLPRDNRSFFYPSVGLGFVLTEAIEIPQNIVSFAKLRASYAEVGQQPDGAYLTRTNYLKGGAGSGYLSDGITFPFNGLGALSLSDQLRSNELRPQNTKTKEIGADLRFLNNRFTIDYTYFMQDAQDQIFPVPSSAATGFTTRYINAGSMEIKGHELTVGVTPVQNDLITWNITGNLTSYRNRVIALSEGIDNIFLGGFTQPNVRAQVGNYYPVIFGTRFKRSPAGEVVVDAEGYPVVADDLGVIGNAQPDFELGINNSVAIKGFTLSAQVDIRKGGEMYAGNTRLAKLYGMDKVTEDRESEYIYPGVVENVDANGNVTSYTSNTTPILRDQIYYQQVMDLIDETNVYKTDFVRLREVSLGYTLPKSLVSKTKYFSNVSLTLIGRNLKLWTDYPNFDPETSVGGATNFQGLEYVNLPQTRSYGVSLRASF